MRPTRGIFLLFVAATAMVLGLLAEVWVLPGSGRQWLLTGLVVVVGTPLWIGTYRGTMRIWPPLALWVTFWGVIGGGVLVARIWGSRVGWETVGISALALVLGFALGRFLDLLADR